MRKILLLIGICFIMVLPDIFAQSQPLQTQKKNTVLGPITALFCLQASKRYQAVFNQSMV